MDEERATKRAANNWLDWGPPWRLMQEVNGPWPDKLAEVVRQIDQLPPAFKESLSSYGSALFIRDLRRLTHGMRKLREDRELFKEELLNLAGPTGLLRPLADKFRDAAANEPIDAATLEIVERRIIAPLEEGAQVFHWQTRGLLSAPMIQDWAEESSDFAPPEPKA